MNEERNCRDTRSNNSCQGERSCRDARPNNFCQGERSCRDTRSNNFCQGERSCRDARSNNFCQPEGVFRTAWKSRENACGLPEETERNCPCAACRISDREPERTQENRGTGSCPRCAAGIRDTSLLCGQSLAMVYTPSQKFEKVYEPKKALCRGTSFYELDKPFLGDRRDRK